LSPGGIVAAVVWDYAEGMEFLREFWSAAAALDPSAAQLDEANRFPICRPEELLRIFDTPGLADVRVAPLVIDTHFMDLNDLWMPFLGGTGPAPTYLSTLAASDRTRLREELARRIPMQSDGSIHLQARAWAVAGRTRS
jgi:hypothetical protein